MQRTDKRTSLLSRRFRKKVLFNWNQILMQKRFSKNHFNHSTQLSTSFYFNFIFLRNDFTTINTIPIKVQLHWQSLAAKNASNSSCICLSFIGNKATHRFCWYTAELPKVSVASVVITGIFVITCCQFKYTLTNET
jgi:hypothetical protein